MMWIQWFAIVAQGVSNNYAIYYTYLQNPCIIYFIPNVVSIAMLRYLLALGNCWNIKFANW